MIPWRTIAINGRVKRTLSYAVALSIVWAPFAAAQPDATTDVDASTTPEQQSPLAPEQAKPAPRPLTLEDLMSGTAPFEPPPAPATEAPRTAPPDPVVALPLPVSPAVPPQTSYVAPALPAVRASPPAAPSIGPRPVFIGDRGATPDAPPTSRDAAYEQRVLGVFHSAQGRQGALDGRWRVAANGVDVYLLQFSDPGAGESRVEGVWRNLRQTGSLAASGFVDPISREGDEVVIRFTDVNRRSAEIRLRDDARGGWAGRVVWPEGAQNVVMTRDVSVETAALAVPAYTPPPPPPAPKARPAPSRSKATATKSRRPAARSRASARRR